MNSAGMVAACELATNAAFGEFAQRPIAASRPADEEEVERFNRFVETGEGWINTFSNDLRQLIFRCGMNLELMPEESVSDVHLLVIESLNYCPANFRRHTDWLAEVARARSQVGSFQRIEGAKWRHMSRSLITVCLIVVAAGTVEGVATKEVADVALRQGLVTASDISAVTLVWLTLTARAQGRTPPLPSSYNHRLVLIALTTRAATAREISQQTPLSPSAVRRYLNELQRDLWVERRGKKAGTNEYLWRLARSLHD